MRTQGVLTPVLYTAVAGLAGLIASAAAKPTATPDLLKAYEAAFNACDAEKFGALLHGDFSGYGASGGLGKGRGSAMDSLKSQCAAGVRYQMTLTIADEALDEKTAFVAANATGTVKTREGRTVDNPLRLTLVLHRVSANDPWLIRHSNISALR